MRSKRTKSETNHPRKQYSHIGCLAWALKRLWRLDRRFWFCVLASIPAELAAPLLTSFFQRELIDTVGAGAGLASAAAVLLAFTPALLTLNLANDYLHSRLEARRYYPTLVCTGQETSFEYYQTDYENTEREDFQKLRGYVWEDRCFGNCSMEFVWRDIREMLLHLTGIVTYASLLLALDPLILLVVTAVSMAAYFTTRWQPSYYENNRHRWEKEIRKRNYLRGLSEDFDKAKDIKLYGMERWLDHMTRDYQAYIRMWERRCNLRGLWASLLSALMAFLQNGVTYLILIGSLMQGGITVGEFVFYFSLAGGIGGFLQGIIGDVAKIHTRAERLARHRAYFDYPSHFNHGKGCALPQEPVAIEFRDVWYRYHGAADDTLKGINLVIPGGEKLALVGMNGAGKTTLVKLLCGMYTPTKGEILVGGRRIEEYNIEEYYSMISAVFQDIHDIAFTCFEFVASVDLHCRGARERAIAAMKAAGIYERIAALPNGIDTHLKKGIYDDGVDLSGGEMQRLVLARAIYKDGALLILDEPTAALDPIAENMLYLHYRELSAGKTSIYISHRFASTQFCDRIILLENGVILESGTHEELMAAGRQYACLFGVQSQYYQEGEIHA